MLFRQKFDTFIRRFDDIGYIVNQGSLNDRVVDASGAVFLEALSREPKSLTKIAVEIASAFQSTPSDFENDILEFYKILEEDGFIVSGETTAELDRKDTRFSYNSTDPKTARRDFTPTIFRTQENTQTYLSSHFKNQPQLISLQIELTSRCNERCVHCYIPHDNKTTDIDFELYADVLRQANDMGLLSLTLSGGEPLLHPGFCDLLRQAKKYDFSINILSNLTLLNDEMLEEMKSAHISSVKVSLYSMNESIHDAITCLPGSHRKTIKAIEKLIRNDIPVQISCPTMKENKDGLADVLHWAYVHKIRAITDFIMMARYDHSADNLNHRLSLDEVKPLILDIVNGDEAYRTHLMNADLKTSLSQNISEDTVCGVCVSSICMVADGSLYPCAGWQSYVLGNVRENSLRDVWENSKAVCYLRGLRKKNFPECLECDDRLFCAMCLVRNANESQTGNPLDVNKHFCDVASLNRQVVEEWLETAK